MKDLKTSTLLYIKEQRKNLDELENSLKDEEGPKGINPGYGYYLLKDSDILQENDEWVCDYRWCKTDKAGSKIAFTGDQYRRQIPIPEGYELLPEDALIKATDKIWHSPTNSWFMNTFYIGESANKYQAAISRKHRPTIEEINLKIAEFMNEVKKNNTEDFKHSFPRYDLSWDALIPVVLRLNRVLSNPIKIGFDLTYIRKQCYEAILKLNK